MKTTLVVVASITAAVYAGIAWQSGRSAEVEFNRLAAAADAAPTLPLTLDHRYKRGFFRSEFDLTLRPAASRLTASALRPRPGAPAAGEFKLVVHGVVHHGPFAGASCFGSARTVMTLELSDAVRAQLKSALGTSEPVLVDSCHGFFGARKLVATSPKFVAPLKFGPFQVESDGFEFTLRSTHGGTALTSAGRLPRFEVTGPNDAHFALKGLALEGQQTLVKGSLYDGFARASIDSISGAGPNGQPQLDMQFFKVESTSASGGGFTTLTYAMGVGPVQAPSFRVNEAHMDFALSHLDSATIIAMSEATQTLNADESLSASDRGTKSIAVIREHGMALLANAPELEVTRVSVDVDTGGALLTGAVRVPGVVPGDTMPELMKKVEADFDLRIDDGVFAAFGSADRQGSIDRAVAQGFVTHEDGHVATHIRVRAGTMTLNDHPYH